MIPFRYSNEILERAFDGEIRIKYQSFDLHTITLMEPMLNRTLTRGCNGLEISLYKLAKREINSDNCQA